MDVDEREIAVLVLLRETGGEGSITTLAGYLSTLKAKTSEMAFQLSRGTLSKHLNTLRRMGLLDIEMVGPTKFYKLTEAGKQALEDFAANEPQKLRVRTWALYIKEYISSED